MIYDIIIIGGGPAGLTAALYALRNNKTVLIIEEGAFGGQITYSPKIENYPGHKSMSGNELAEMMVEQVLEAGAEVEIGKVISVKKDDNITVKTEDGEFVCKAAIIAVGVKHRMLNLPDEERFVGKGISFCAVCDGAFYRDKSVAVIGGGNSALQEAILLSENCSEVIIVQDMPYLTGEKKLCDTLLSKKNVRVIYNSKVLKLLGKEELSAIEISENGENKTLAIDGMFIAIGLIPQNKPFSDIAKTDNQGYFDSDENCITVSDGIFVAGDCRKKSVRQVTTAAADGAVAAIAACKYIDK